MDTFLFNFKMSSNITQQKIDLNCESFPSNIYYPELGYFLVIISTIGVFSNIFVLVMLNYRKSKDKSKLLLFNLMTACDLVVSGVSNFIFAYQFLIYNSPDCILGVFRRLFIYPVYALYGFFLLQISAYCYDTVINAMNRKMTFKMHVCFALVSCMACIFFTVICIPKIDRSLIVGVFGTIIAQCLFITIFFTFCYFSINKKLSEVHQQDADAVYHNNSRTKSKVILAIILVNVIVYCLTWMMVGISGILYVLSLLGNSFVFVYNSSLIILGCRSSFSSLLMFHRLPEFRAGFQYYFQVNNTSSSSSQSGQQTCSFELKSSAINILTLPRCDTTSKIPI